MKEIKSGENENGLKGAGKGKDRQKAVTERLSKISLKNKTKQ